MAIAADITDGNVQHDPHAIWDKMGERRPAKAQSMLMEMGPSSPAIGVVRTGWALRAISSANGKTQILSVLIPGDMFGFQAMVSAHIDYNVIALTDVVWARIPTAAIYRLQNSHPSIIHELWRASFAEQRRLEQQIAAMGTLAAEKRIASLLLDLYDRLTERHLAATPWFYLPLTQRHLADLLGLTSVHVSRVLRRLRDDDIVTYSRRAVRIHDLPALKSLVGGSASPSSSRLGGGATVPAMRARASGKPQQVAIQNAALPSGQLD
jgi:CRP-like cAMP-binding protein